MKKLLLFLLLPLISIAQVQIGNDITFTIPSNPDTVATSLSNDGNVLAVANVDLIEVGNEVKVYQNVNGAWVQLGSTLVGNAQQAYFGSSIVLSGNGNILAVASGVFANSITFNGGVVSIYELQNNQWVLLQELQNPNITDINNAENSGFGASISLNDDGSVMVVGAPFGIPFTGNGFNAVNVFERNNNQWVVKGNTLIEVNEGFGGSVDISGDGNIIAIGTEGDPFINTSTGKVEVFEFVGNTWNIIGQSINVLAVSDSASGCSLSSDGNIVAMGSSDDSGYVGVFERISNNWVQIGNYIFGESSSDAAGIFELSGDGSTLVIGSPLNNGSASNGPGGKVRRFKNTNNQWIQEGNELLGDVGTNWFDALGRSVNISFDGFVVAAAAVEYLGVYDYSSFSITTNDTEIILCSDTVTEVVYNFTFTIPLGFSENTTFSASGLPAGASVNFTPQSLNTAGNFTMTVGNLDTAAQGNFTITVTATAQSITDSVDVELINECITCNNYVSTSNDLPLTITDGLPGGGVGQPVANTILNIPDSNIIESMTVTVDISHTYVNDLIVQLVHPDGTTQMNLWAQECVSENNLTNVTFDDNANPISCPGGTTSTIQNLTISPSESLSAFTGLDAQGDWTLFISDTFAADTGELNGWSIEICNSQTLSTPEFEISNLSIFPNPNNGEFTIGFDSNIEEDITIEVYDLRGRVIFTQKFSSKSRFEEVITLKDALPGMYLLHISDGNKRTAKKIIVE